MEYTREKLIEICEKAIVQESRWRDRDSQIAHEQLGSAWALLKAGCAFKIKTEGKEHYIGKTIWIEIYSRGFESFEYNEYNLTKSTHYLPTENILTTLKGADWY